MSTSRACTAAVAAALVVLAAAPAAAAGGITSPGAGEVVTEHGVVPLRAVVEGPAEGPSELSLLAPGADSAQVVAVSTEPEGGELAYDFDTACADAVCPEPVPAANGTWTLQLSGAAEDERTFVLRIPPAVPDEVGADRAEVGVRVRWRQGDEPDLRGYRIEASNGAMVRDGIGLDACDADRQCSVEVPEEAGAWTVRAFRASCPDCAQLLASPASAVVTVEGEAPTVEDPAVQPTAAPSSSAAAPGARPDQRGSFLSAFGTGRLAVPPPPPAGSATLPALPEAAGTFDEELGYAPQELVVTESRPPLARARDAVGSALGSGDRWRLLVLSALLVGAAFWLRRWSRRAIQE